jgi:membrane protease YdiL (CAAX protease family)
MRTFPKLRQLGASWFYPKMPWDFILIFFVFAVIVPWRGWARMQRLLALPSVTGNDRMRLYMTSIASQWILSAVIAWRAFARGLRWTDLGFQFQPVATLFLVGLAGAALLGLAHWFNLRRVSRSSNPQVERLRALAAKIFPHSDREAALFCGLSGTAGICEEFLYRGFVFAALAQVHIPTWGILLISSVHFGLAHAYQGRGGILGTLVLGTVFGSVRILYDSLVPVILWHIAVDVFAGFAGRRYLTENK